MPAEAIELAESEEGTKEVDESRMYLIRNASGKSDAMAAVEAVAPASIGNLIRQPVNVRPIPGAPGAWFGAARYGLNDFTPPTSGDSSLSFDTGGEAIHVNTSPLGEPIATYAPTGGTVPLTNGLIGITKSGIEGVDRGAPVLDFTVTKIVSAAQMTQEYIGRLFHSSWKTNHATWSTVVNGISMEFAQGEVLFKGVSGSSRGLDGDYELSFKFSASPNRSDMVVGGIGGISKRGWEYLWVITEDIEDDAAFVLTRKVVAVYVEEIYDPWDFAQLEPDWEEPEE